MEATRQVRPPQASDHSHAAKSLSRWFVEGDRASCGAHSAAVASSDESGAEIAMVVVVVLKASLLEPRSRRPRCALLPPSTRQETCAESPSFDVYGLDMMLNMMLNMPLNISHNVSRNAIAEFTPSGLRKRNTSVAGFPSAHSLTTATRCK